MIVSDSVGSLLPFAVLAAPLVVTVAVLTVRRRPAIALAVSLVAIIAGLSVTVGVLGPISFGWFSYAPLGDPGVPSDAWTVRPSGLLITGAGLFGLGVVVGAARPALPGPHASGPDT